MIAKRVFDLTVVTVAGVVLAPVYALLAVLVRHNLGRPVLFTQQRPGLHGRPFRIVKLRTMTDARDASGRLLPDEDRLPRSAGSCARPAWTSSRSCGTSSVAT